MHRNRHTALYFINSPLHYLAAESIAHNFESGNEQILVYLRKGNIESIIDKTKWDKVIHMPWPRHEPLPGPFGRIKRIKENLFMIADLLKQKEEIHIHAHEYDNEAINYFINFLPDKLDAKLYFRILPDGTMNLSKHPIKPYKYIAQCLRKLRRLVMPELNYHCYKGDRLGADADFVDRIYILPNFSHQYSPAKAVSLPALAPSQTPSKDTDSAKALIIGEYFLGAKKMDEADVSYVRDHIYEWLKEKHIEHVDFKPHPRDTNHEFWHEGYNLLKIQIPLETYMSNHHYDYVISVDSTALLLAKAIYPKNSRIISFDIDKSKIKDPHARQRLLDFMDQIGIEQIS